MSDVHTAIYCHRWSGTNAQSAPKVVSVLRLFFYTMLRLIDSRFRLPRPRTYGRQLTTYEFSWRTISYNSSTVKRVHYPYSSVAQPAFGQKHTRELLFDSWSDSDGLDYLWCSFFKMLHHLGHDATKQHHPCAAAISSTSVIFARTTWCLTRLQSLYWWKRLFHSQVRSDSSMLYIVICHMQVTNDGSS